MRIGLLETDRLSVVQLLPEGRNIRIPDGYTLGGRARNIPYSQALAMSQAELELVFLTKITDVRASVDEFHAATNQRIEQNGQDWELRHDVIELTVDGAKDVLVRRLRQAKNRVRDGGAVSVGGNGVATDVESVATLNAAHNAFDAGRTFPAGGYPITATAGTRHRVTQNQFNAIVADVAEHRVLVEKNYFDHLDAIDALATFAEVVAYDVTTGWPANP